MHNHSFTRRQVFTAAGLAGLATLPACSAGKSERLTITKIEVFQVVVPMQDDIINSPEFNPDALSEFPKGPKVIIKLHTDSGLVGIGETSRNVPKEGALENARHLEGQAVLDLNLPRLALPDGRSRAGFEIALYDIVGRPSAGRYINCSAGWRRTKSTCLTGAAGRIRWMQSASRSGL